MSTPVETDQLNSLLIEQGLDDEANLESSPVLLTALEPGRCQGERIAILGELAAMTWRAAHDLIIAQGGSVAGEPDSGTTWLVLGAQEFPLPGSELDQTINEQLSPAIRHAIDDGHIRVTDEQTLWDQLGWVDPEQLTQRLHTPAMLAELLNLPLATIRRWQRRGLIRPTVTVQRLPYFDFAEVSTARQLADLLHSALTVTQLERRLGEWSKYLPGAERPLQQLALIARDKQLLVRSEVGLQGPGGQLFFDFETPNFTPVVSNTLATEYEPETRDILSLAAVRAAREQAWSPNSVQDQTPVDVLLEMAAEMEDLEDLPAAADLYRLVLAQQGPSPEVNFLLADVLYRQGELTAARERYAVAIELDEEYVEARANLGCVLAELGDRDLAVAAFQGALQSHPDYADVHFHLARTLMELKQHNVARPHWQRFIELSPASPWVSEARRHLAAQSTES